MVQPYHSLAMALEEMQPGDPALKLPDAAQPSRVLAPFQTSQERAVSLKPRRVNPILVLTCYEPDLEEAWSQLAGMGHDNISAELDNSDLYNVGDEWPKVLIRIPDIVDTIRGGVPEDYDNRIPEDGDLIPASPQYASNHEVALLYVVDQKALREGLVQVKWLDWKAELVWENKIARDYMHPIRGLFHEGFSLYEILGADDEAERGALLCE